MRIFLTWFGHMKASDGTFFETDSAEHAARKLALKHDNYKHPVLVIDTENGEKWCYELTKEVKATRRDL